MLAPPITIVSKILHANGHRFYLLSSCSSN